MLCPIFNIVVGLIFTVLDQKQDNCGSMMISSNSQDQDKFPQIQLGWSDNVISALQYENISTSADLILHEQYSIIQWIYYHVMAIRMDEMR